VLAKSEWIRIFGPIYLDLFQEMIGGLHLGRKQSQLYLPSRIPGERQLAQCSFFDFQAGRPPSPSPDGSQSPDRNRVCLAPDQVRAHGARPRPSSAQHREWIGLPGRVWPDHAGAAAIVAEAFCWCRVRAGRFFGGRDAGEPRSSGNREREPLLEIFESQDAFAWLCQSANEFGFSLQYP
jgi:hypothetical protein